jgi:hypothetical protein
VEKKKIQKCLKNEREREKEMLYFLFYKITNLKIGKFGITDFPKITKI